MNRITRTRLAAATAAMAALSGAALLAPGAANAAPVSPTAPVPGTQCNVGQVERATAKVAPEFWRHISTNAKAKDRFEQMLVKTPEQRKAARDAAKKAHDARKAEWQKTHPGQTKPAHPKARDGKTKPTKAQVEQKITAIKATCTTS
ncbi:hypothetical protein [Tsukamurella ocularis]|uniref:hypothetical protein n=1 Tax=Tsukamurella ocularis TaxID=1970234 RepID=UPI002169E4E0|nr:hypothetical protein [Tsukamurella ocularis]MCS3782419.1 hypothetical protein [Tsukamurella ocularis]MCS3789824.1 hypothetical protein [Tsukamurella ocularis]MCS3853209.1 hypothetical protein [Tsukamurella ocularis]